MYKKIQELAKFLEISFQVKSSRLDASSSNYRNASMDEMFNQILSKIKTWFPPSIDDVTEGFNSVLLNFNSAVTKAEPDKQIELLKLLPRNWSYAKVKAHFDVSQHVITESKKKKIQFRDSTTFKSRTTLAWIRCPRHSFKFLPKG